MNQQQDLLKLEDDVQVADNVRARRRRARQRRNARLRARRRANGIAPNSGPLFRLPANQRGAGNGRRLGRHNASNVEPNEFDEKAEEVISLRQVLSPDIIRFSEAVTNPFGNGALGAVLPDQFQELVTPCVDRHELDIGFTGFNFAGDWTADATIRLLGAFFWLQPRCFEAGAIAQDDGAAAPIYPSWTNPGVTSDADAEVLTHQYVLCYIGLWSTPTGNALGFYNNTFVDASQGYRIIPYPRIGNIDDNCIKGRILGMGLKLWSEEAPIETGGYVVGGWITMAECFRAATDLTILESVQQRIKGAVRRPGLKGVTVRYSPLQTPAQLEAERVKIPANLWIPRQVGNRTIPIANNGMDLSSMDVITPGTYVPAAFWRFNNTNPSGSNTEGVYTLKVMSMVHFEGSPNGISPFMSQHIDKDIGVDHIKSVLENWQVYPPATGGHSFKSFMTKAKHVIAKVAKGAAHFNRLMALLDSYSNTLDF